jgi:hypothetical protein
MAIRISEDKTSDQQGFNWNKISASLEPEIHMLPEEDRRYFKSKVKLLIGKEIRLSNIPKEHMYVYIKRVDWILLLLRYPMYVTPEFIRGEITKFLSRLGLQISEKGLGWKYGPMGFQHSSIKQEIIQPEREIK